MGLNFEIMKGVEFIADDIRDYITSTLKLKKNYENTLRKRTLCIKLNPSNCVFSHSVLKFQRKE